MHASAISPPHTNPALRFVTKLASQSIQARLPQPDRGCNSLATGACR